jgi:DNA excision repair protein ERCC-6
MRRLKRHVFSATSANNSALPEKREEIVFCRITPYQRNLYEAFIGSDEVEAIMERRRNVLAGVDVLRKICNHPDLIELYCSEQRFVHEEAEVEADDYEHSPDFARNLHGSVFANVSRPRLHAERSGKIGVLSKILDLWHEQGHRALIFCQTRQMLNILEVFLQQSKGQMKFLRMDGATPIKNRLELVDDFNRADSPYFLFLLTTRVGGLGINLTGANRVIIYDPDWNPSTDLQARERVYRLGQTRQVSILRLITAGTIEEKIYHRQIFKQYLTQRILEDPKQTRFFRAADLYDLFSLNLDESTETGDMFAGLHEEFAKKMGGDQPGELGSEESDPVLNDLLDMVGVHSTLPTTSITEQIRPELALIEREAQKVAEAALKALKQQRISPAEVSLKRPRTDADHYNTFKPTWTGRFGEQGSFGSSTVQTPTEGPSVKDILDAIKRRKQSSSTNLAEEPSLQLALSIVDYFNRISGAVDSDQLAHAFRGQVPDSESAVLFRLLLKQVAALNRSTRKWRLKEEFIQK